MKSEMHECLTNNILHFWLDRMVDNEQGGFYGRIDGNDHIVADAEKGAILNARILWAFAAAYRVLGDHRYLDAALRAKEYILNHFIDKEYGEWYWSINEDGSINRNDDKAGFWKCPYHNTRMCLEIMERM